MPTTTGISFDGVDDEVTRTITGTASSNKKFTLAEWIEVASSGGEVAAFETVNGSQVTFGLAGDAGFGGIIPAQRAFFYIVNDNGEAMLYHSPSNITYGVKYFMMLVYDSAQATQANRLKVWFGPYSGAVALISGWTDFLGTGNTITLNATLDHGNLVDNLGNPGATISKGKMADVYWLDNVALADPSSLLNNYASAAAPGTYAGSYGNTGYHLDFSNAGSLGADSSGNGNNFTPSGGPTQLTGYFAGGSNKTLSAGAGSYGVTGSTAGVKRGRKVGAAAGSFAWNGVSASLLKSIVNKTIAGGAGAFTYTGATAGLRRAEKIAAGAGSFGVTGSPAALRQARKLVGGVGSFALSGVAATLLRHKGFTAVPGSYGLSGAAAALREMKKLAAGGGSYGVTGANAGVLYSGKRVIAGPGTYAWNGVASGILVSVDGETREPWQFSPFFEPLRGI